MLENVLTVKSEKVTWLGRIALKRIIFFLFHKGGVMNMITYIMLVCLVMEKQANRITAQNPFRSLQG